MHMLTVSRHLTTTSDKPSEMDVCTYIDSCSDGIMNGDEEGVDCGGECEECEEVVIEVPPQVEIYAEPIIGEILELYNFSVSVRNNGTVQVSELNVQVDKWTDATDYHEILLPGDESVFNFKLNLPLDADENNLTVKVFDMGQLLVEKTVSVSLTVPDYSLMIYEDPNTKELYSVLIVDNRDKSSRKVVSEYSVDKDGETYIYEEPKTFDIADNAIYYNITKLYASDLPDGDYNVRSVFYENDNVLSEKVTKVSFEGDNKSFNAQLISYLLLGMIIMLTAYMYLRIRD